MKIGCHDEMRHPEKELSNPSTRSPPLREIKKEAHQISGAQPMSKKVREKKNLCHVQSAKERIMEKRIAGIKEKLNATIARSLITLKVSVDSRHIKRACRKQ